jgi:uroporphyrinogen decarboxylase
MDSRERVWRAVKFEGPDRVPIDLWSVPGAWQRHGAALTELLARYPLDMGPSGYRCAWEDPAQCDVGQWRDPWGVGWENAEKGVFAQAKVHPAADDAAMRGYQPPWELAAAGCEEIERTLQADHSRFVGGGFIRIFERLQWLRGMEALLIDLVEGNPDLLTLRDRVHAFNMANLRQLLRYDLDAITFSDDWGSQSALLISPRIWRRVFAPCYREMFAETHAAGKLVFFHTDGYTLEIVEDLIGLGVDALNTQVTCMDIPELGRRFAGRVCFWGEADRQHTLPYGSADDVRREVRLIADNLACPGGGLIGLGTAMADVPLENVEALLSAWNEAG